MPQIGERRKHPISGAEQFFNENHRWQNCNDRDGESTTSNGRNPQNPAHDYNSVKDTTFKSSPEMSTFLDDLSASGAFKSTKSPMDGVTELKLHSGNIMTIVEEEDGKYTAALHDSNNSELWVRELDEDGLQQSILESAQNGSMFEMSKGLSSRRRRTMKDDAAELSRGNYLTNFVTKFFSRIFPR